MADDFMRKLSESFISGENSEICDVITFVEAPWGLGIKLHPTQRLILKCFYGMPLDDKEECIKVADIVNDKILYRFTEKAYLKWLYEEKRCNVDNIEGKLFRELVLVLGRRSGKSLLASCISGYELYKLVKRGDPSKYYGLAPQQEIAVMNVAPTDDQASVVFEQTMKLLMNCPYLKDRIVNHTQSYFNLQSDADIKNLGKKIASLVGIAGGCSSNSLRGRSSLAVIMDEMAFFLTNGGRFSGEEVYRALTPSTATFRNDGKIICISSPYAKYGMFYERYRDSFDAKDNKDNITLMFKMYTAMVNPEVDTVMLKAERRRNSNTFYCEYGGEFSDSVTAWIDDPIQFQNCVNKELPHKTRGDVGITYFMGLDLGLKNDGTAIAIVHKDDNVSKIILDYADVWFSGSSDVWEREGSIYKNCREFATEEIIKVGKIADKIDNLVKWFPIKSGWFDQYNGYSLMEQLVNIGLKQFRMEHVTDTLNSDIYQLFKTLYLDQLVEFPDHPIAIPELLSLEAEYIGKSIHTSTASELAQHDKKGKVKVRAPNKQCCHDDISDAIARAIYECYNFYAEKGIKLTTGTNKRGFQVTNDGPISSIPVTSNTFRYKQLQKHGFNQRVATGNKMVKSMGHGGRFMR